MNRKAQTGTIILFVIALALAVSTIYIFATTEERLTTQSNDLSIMMSNAILAEGYIAPLTLKLIIKEAAQTSLNKETIIAISLNSPALSRETENLSGKLARGEFDLISNNGKTTIQIQNIELTSQSGENKIERTIDTCMEFDNEGNFLQNCQQT